MKLQLNILILLILFCASFSHLRAQEADEIIGKWDLTVQMDSVELPSWLEVYLSGSETLVGHFVEYNGSARPISEVHFHNGVVDFTIPPQWNGKSDLHFSALLKEGKLEGTLLADKGKAYTFVGVPAPKLLREMPKKWSKPISLFKGTSLEGWKPQFENMQNQWVADNGILKSPKSGVNLLTEQVFDDFKLHIEVRVPKGSNSGIYLRGRYEVQVEDSYGKDPNKILFGGIYGFLTPNEMVAKPAGEWQVFDITLVGRRVTVVANGKSIITNQIIPGITGGALDSKEALPGPILLQGDHGPIEYRSISIQIPENDS